VFPPVRRKPPKPAVRVAPPKPGLRPPKSSAPAPRRVARLIDEDESTLLDVIDNLLSKGVVINAEVILALANVDLVYLRLSALLCAADRVLQPSTHAPRARGSRRNDDGREGG
jgi:gas vesicle structural protein